MIFNLAIVAMFLVSLNIVLAADNYNSNINNTFESFSGWEDNTDINLESSTSASSSSIRKRGSETSSLMEPNEIKRCRPMYNKTVPSIDPKVDDNEVKILAEWERRLISEGDTCKWKNFRKLETNDVKELCIEVWKIHAQKILEIKLEDSMIADCEPALNPGPSKLYEKSSSFVGYFHYDMELKGKNFFPDLVRCTCAYRKWMHRAKTFKTAFNSKRYFFLMWYSDTIYYVLTTIDDGSGKTVKIVNVHRAKIYKPKAQRPQTIPIQ